MESTSEITSLLQAPTAKEKIKNEQFKTKGLTHSKGICPYSTQLFCMKMNYSTKACDMVHFKQYVQDHTDMTLGNCKLLSLCASMDTCKYVHYIPDDTV